MARFELATPCLQGRCNNHYATSADLLQSNQQSVRDAKRKSYACVLFYAEKSETNLA